MLNKSSQSETAEKYLGCLEFQDNKGEFHVWEIVRRGNVFVIGTACNVGLIPSYQATIDPDCETEDGMLQEILADLEAEANDGAQYMSRVIPFNS